jgi:hypothetical protein
MKKKAPAVLKRIARFPRLEGITGRVRTYEKVLRHAYNNLYQKRNPWARGGRVRFDVYTAKYLLKRENPQTQFQILAKQLSQRTGKSRIDPALYIKVMAQYGHYQNSRYLPAPSWLAKEKTVEIYEWLHEKSRNKFKLEADWRKSKQGYRESDIFIAIESSAEFLMRTCDLLKQNEKDAIVMLLSELNPWFTATYLVSATKAVCDLLLVILRSDRTLYQDVITCMMYFRGHSMTWKRCRKILEEKLGQDEAIPQRFPRI